MSSASTRKKTEGSAPADANLPTFYDKRIIIAAGAKGSSGKSTILLNLVDWYLQMDQPPVLAVFDPDVENRTLTRALHSEAKHGLKAPHVFDTINWRSEAKQVEIDRIVRILCAPVLPKLKNEDIIQAKANQPCISVLDGVANQMSDVLLWLNDIRLFEMGRELGFRVTFLLCVDDAEDTANAAKELVKVIDDRAQYVIIRNLKHGGNSLSFDGAKTRHRVLNELGGGEITFDGFSKDLKLVCEGARIMVADGHDLEPKSLWRASQSGDRFVMARAFTRWNTLVDQFNRCRHLLLPDQYLAGGDEDAP